MKISEVITALQKIEEQHGDVEVMAHNECGASNNVLEGDIIVHARGHHRDETVVEFDV